MSATVMAKVRAALGPDIASRQQAVAQWMAAGRASGTPALAASVSAADAVAIFVARARAVKATVDVIAAAALAERIGTQTAQWGRHGGVAIADRPVLRALREAPWANGARIGAVTATDAVGIVQADGGAAETGTLVLVSGHGQPTAMAFLPEHCIAVVPASAIRLDYNAVIRAHCAGRDWPRSINLVTGPSRTADIEEVLLLGAHGPRSLTIYVLEDC